MHGRRALPAGTMLEAPYFILHSHWKFSLAEQAKAAGTLQSDRECVQEFPHIWDTHACGKQFLE